MCLKHWGLHVCDQDNMVVAHAATCVMASAIILLIQCNLVVLVLYQCIKVVHNGYNGIPLHTGHYDMLWRKTAKNEVFHRYPLEISYRFTILVKEDIRGNLKPFSYTLSREYRVMRYRYARLLFTSEDHLCANLRVQEQSTNMTSQCQCPTFAWRHRSTVVTSQY